jgi:hypothetical protein
MGHGSPYQKEIRSKGIGTAKRLPDPPRICRAHGFGDADAELKKTGNVRAPPFVSGSRFSRFPLWIV